MKPDWDKLMDAYEGSPAVLVADVDCTADGKQLCETHKIRSFPGMKWGHPSNLQEYKGGRSYNELWEFSKTRLKPQCSAANPSQCDDATQRIIEEIKALSLSELKQRIEKSNKAVEEAESNNKKAMEDELRTLQNDLERLKQEDKKQGPNWDHLPKEQREIAEARLAEQSAKLKAMLADKTPMDVKTSKAKGAALMAENDKLLKEFPKKSNPKYNANANRQQRKVVHQRMTEIRDKYDAIISKSKDPHMYLLEEDLKIRQRRDEL